MTATEAAARLGVKRETVYAYASRGLLRSTRAPDGRSSLFDPGEVERLATRTRRGVGSSALRDERARGRRDRAGPDRGPGRVPPSGRLRTGPRCVARGAAVVAPLRTRPRARTSPHPRRRDGAVRGPRVEPVDGRG